VWPHRIAALCLALALALPLFFAAEAARAALIRDADELSVALEPSGARACVMFPVSARDPVACAGVKPAAQEPPSRPGSRNIASGVIVVDGDAGPTRAAVFAFSWIAMEHSAEPDQETAAAFARGIADATRSDLHSGVRGGVPLTQLHAVDGLTVARITYDLDGLPEYKRAVMEHDVVNAVWVEGGVYSLLFMSSSEQAAFVDDLAEQSGSTIHVTHPAPPHASPSSRAGYAIGYFVGSFVCVGGTLIGAIVAAVFLLRKRSSPKPPPPPAPPAMP
jgi:hypothetical protein